jgi:CheY-like chemotaxis protein
MIGDKWILLTEDNVNDADLAIRALSSGEASVEIVVARDGAEAMDYLHCHGKLCHKRMHPAVVLLDLKMPRMNGFAVLEEIKGDAQLKQIPVVVFTSSREERDVMRCYQLGANGYVVKPMDFPKYVAALKGVAHFWTVTNEPPPDSAQQETERGVEDREHHCV